MQNITFIDNLIAFGLTRLEASIYECLLTFGEMSGYEVVKETGISRSNVYSSLSALVDKGAAYLLEGDVSKYTAVDVKLFVQNTLNNLSEKGSIIVQNAPAKVQASTGYITIVGSTNIKNKVHEMLSTVEQRLYFMADSQILGNFKSDIEGVVKEGKKVVIISDEEVVKLSPDAKKNGSMYYRTECESGQLRLITDSSFVLTGEYTQSPNNTCLYSGQQNLVKVMKEALGNRIKNEEYNMKEI